MTVYLVVFGLVLVRIVMAVVAYRIRLRRTGNRSEAMTFGVLAGVLGLLGLLLAILIRPRNLRTCPWCLTRVDATTTICPRCNDRGPDGGARRPFSEPGPMRVQLEVADEVRCEDIVDVILRGGSPPTFDLAERDELAAYSAFLRDRAMVEDSPRDARRAIIAFVLGNPEAVDPSDYVDDLAGVVIMGEIVGIDVPYVCAVASRCAIGPSQDLVRSFGERSDVDTSSFPWHVVGGVLRRTDRPDDRGAAEST